MPNWLHHGVNNVAIECLPCLGKVYLQNWFINPESMHDTIVAKKPN